MRRSRQHVGEMGRDLALGCLGKHPQGACRALARVSRTMVLMPVKGITWLSRDTLILIPSARKVTFCLSFASSRHVLYLELTHTVSTNRPRPPPIKRSQLALPDDTPIPSSNTGT